MIVQSYKIATTKRPSQRTSRACPLALACLIAPILLLAGSVSADELGKIVAHAPLIQAQTDGVLYLNTAAAAQVRWDGKQPHAEPSGDSITWDGAAVRPYWRIQVPESGLYQVVINRSAPPGRESSAAIYFWKDLTGRESARVTSPIENSGSWEIFTPFVMGEAKLQAGEYVVEYRPTSWMSSRYLIGLADLRLIPLDPLTRLDKPFHNLTQQLKIDQDPALQALAAQAANINAQVHQLDQLTRQKDFRQFTDYAQFFAHDQAHAQMGTLQPEVTKLSRQLRDATLAKVTALTNLTPEQSTIFSNYFQAKAAVLEGAQRDYPKVYVTPRSPTTEPAPASARKTLFPVGEFDQLPKLSWDPTQATHYTIPPPPDAAARRARFDARDTDAGIAELAQQFQAVLVPGTPGLERFEQLCQQKQWRAALDAYRAYFFAKLADPEKYGVHTENFVDVLARQRGKALLLRNPDPAIVALNMRGVAAFNLSQPPATFTLGEPGTVWWAPTDLVPPADVKPARGSRGGYWKSPAGKKFAVRREFYRNLRLLPGDNDAWQSGSAFFPALLFDYTVNDHPASLARWCAYLDDFAMNGRRDENAAPLDFRQVTELETGQIEAQTLMLRIMLDERPALATDFNSATLARLMMLLVQDYAPYTIRARRAEQANWGIMGIGILSNISNFFPEYRAMQYYNREAWRLWGSDFIQHRTLDGENIESWDTGHNGIDIPFGIGAWTYSRLAPGFDQLSLDSLYDQVRVNERSLLVHLTPAGCYWPTWNIKTSLFQNSVRSRYLQLNLLDQIESEPGARDRIETVMSGGHPAQATLPSVTSDLAPYGAMAYLRESWQPGAASLIFQNFETRSQDLAMSPKTGYSLAQGGRYLIEVSPIVVDRKPDDRYAGHPRTGGKTDYCGQAGRHVQDMRFLSTSRFDYVDGWQDTPYAIPEFTQRADFFGLYRNDAGGKDPHPITTVKSLRQIFHVRGEDLWLIADRIEAPADATHEYSQFAALPVRIPEEGFAERVAVLAKAGNQLIERDPDGHWLHTSNPGFDNVSAWFIGPQPLIVGNDLNAKRDHVKYSQLPLPTIQDEIAGGQTWQDIMSTRARNGKQACSIYPSSVRWTGRGNQSFLTVLTGESPVFDSATPVANNLHNLTRLDGPGGLIGCHALTASGAEVWLQTGPQRVNSLTAGPVSATAESLLSVRQADTISGLVLGCRQLAINGRSYPVTGDFEFVLSATGQLETTPIRRPIDTVRISPEQNVFTNSVRVSFDIPTQKTAEVEFHYTLDGSDPTLKSPLYNGAFTITETTRVKVRPFRVGLKDTPWNIPGTDAGKTVWAIFRKESVRPAVKVAGLTPGLSVQYFQDDWLKLFTYAGMAGVLPPQTTRTTRALLDPADVATLRQTDQAYALRYQGYLNVPATGIYSFYAPEHLYTSTMDAGYDLRVWVDGEEWLPNPDLHSENIWHIPLAQGAHKFTVAFTDYRWKQFRDEYWMNWKEEEMWRGTPALEVAGPGLARQPLPANWLFRDSL